VAPTPPASAPHVSAPAQASATTAERTLEREPAPAVEAAVSTLDHTAQRALAAIDRAIAGPAPAPAESEATTAAPPASTSLGRESTLSEAAEALADDLSRIPGIQRFGEMRLSDLDTAGPRPLRTMWRIARDRLERDYGELTIGEIIDRYQGRGGGGVSAGA